MKRIIIMNMIARMLAAVASLLMMAPRMAAPESADLVRINLIAHRGYAAQYTENTLDAFSDAYDKGFAGIELDVYEGRDHTIFVHHDTTFLRLTGKNLYVWDLTMDNRDQYLLDGKSPVPTLEEVLELASLHPGWLYIHMKDDVDHGYTIEERMIAKIEALLKDYHMQARTIVFAGKRNIKRFVGHYDLHFGIITGKSTMDKLGPLADWCGENHVEEVLFLYMTCLEDHAEEKVGLFRDKGVQCGVYTVTTAEELKKLNDLGCRTAISDDKLDDKLALRD